MMSSCFHHKELCHKANFFQWWWSKLCICPLPNRSEFKPLFLLNACELLSTEVHAVPTSTLEQWPGCNMLGMLQLLSVLSFAWPCCPMFTSQILSPARSSLLQQCLRQLPLPHLAQGAEHCLAPRPLSVDDMGVGHLTDGLWETKLLNECSHRNKSATSPDSMNRLLIDIELHVSFNEIKQHWKQTVIIL